MKEEAGFHKGADPCLHKWWGWESATEKTALPGEKSHQTEAGENGTMVEEASGAGILPRGCSVASGKKEVNQILRADRVLPKVQI